ncbi:MAG: hypothetical protein QOE63_888 [Acidimicrobiaceae bacterium]|jgi:pimeloyl-ACP methyl ester carboxylesterase
MPTVDVDGVELAFDVYGEGDPVLLICGLGQPAFTWQLGMAPGLVAAGFQVVTFDNRGVAPSSAPPAPYTVEAMTADTVGLLEHLALGPTHVVGYSLGAWIAEVLAHDQPGLVRSAALVGGANRTSAWERVRYHHTRDLFAAGIELPSPAQTIEMMNYLPNHALQDDAIVEMFLSLAGADIPFPDPGRIGQWEAAVAWADDTERTGRWSEITVPTLVLAFEHDIDSPPRHAEDAAGEIPGARFVEIADETHLGPMLHADRVVPVLVDFFASVR